MKFTANYATVRSFLNIVTVDTVVYCAITSIHNIIGKLSVNEREGNPNPKAPILATFIEKNGVVVVAMKMRDRFQQMRSGGQTKVDFKIL